jgi:dTDP-4-dehydrorhamnose 3,5-epimerase
MKIIATDLPEVLVIEPSVFRDERGYFYESYNRTAFSAAVGYEVEFVQDNHSRSAMSVLRGLHFQRPPRAQGKLVRVTKGRAFDVAVDIRPDSPQFGQWTSVELSADNFRQLWIPAGFAHGFLTLEDDTHVQYKTTDYYAREFEGCIRWNDATIGIRWPLPNGLQPLLSPKDAVAPGSSSLMTEA